MVQYTMYMYTVPLHILHAQIHILYVYVYMYTLSLQRVELQ